MVAYQSTNTQRLLLIGLASLEIEATSALFILRQDDIPRPYTDSRLHPIPGRAKHTPGVGLQQPKIAASPCYKTTPSSTNNGPTDFCLLQSFLTEPQAPPSILWLLSWLRLVFHETHFSTAMSRLVSQLLGPEASHCPSLLEYLFRVWGSHHT